MILEGLASYDDKGNYQRPRGDGTRAVAHVTHAYEMTLPREKRNADRKFIGIQCNVTVEDSVIDVDPGVFEGELIAADCAQTTTKNINQISASKSAASKLARVLRYRIALVPDPESYAGRAEWLGDIMKSMRARMNSRSNCVQYHENRVVRDAV